MILPFLEYFLCQSQQRPQRSDRGYASSAVVWERLERIARAADKHKIENSRLAKRVLSTGPCPGLWRVFYAITTHVERYERINLQNYLGIPLSGQTDTHGLGLLFEAWVNDANRRYNLFAESGNLSHLASIQGQLGTHYTQRATTLQAQSTSEELLSTKIEVSPNINMSKRPPIDLNPDGIFPYSAIGAVFESKISNPTYETFDHELALYAIACEKDKALDFDYAIILHSNYPHGQLSSVVRQITDSAIAQVEVNLEKFLLLIQETEIDAGPSGPGFDSWGAFLQRPSGLPPRDEKGYCASCPYQNRCYAEGGEPLATS